MARALDLSPKTVALHAAAARAKLHARNTAHAVALALRQGLLLLLVAASLHLTPGNLPPRVRGAQGRLVVRLVRTGRVSKRRWRLLD